MRRSLEVCGSNSGAACLVVAVDDLFALPVPTSMKPVGLFDPAHSGIAADQRDAAAKQLAGAALGWSAVAIGTDGQLGVDVNAQTEDEAVGGALEECDKHDRDCRVIAIGPFAVEAN
jgi:adenylate cyclase